MRIIFTQFAWARRAILIAGLIACTPASALADGMQATATFTSATMHWSALADITIQVVNETGEDFAGGLSTDALPGLPYGLEYVSGPNIGNCDSVNGIAAGASCEMTAAVQALELGSFDWSGSVDADGYTLNLTSAAPLLVYGDPATITVVSGDGQRVRTGNVFPQPLVVDVRDAAGYPLAGVDVTFTVPVEWSGATLSASVVQTDANGQASVTATATNHRGDHVIEASADGVVDAAFWLFNIPPPAELRGAVSYSPASIAPGGQATATILLRNTAGYTINVPISTADLPALPNGLTLVGQVDLGGCDFQSSVFSNNNICQMTATVTSSTLGNHKWTGSGQTNDAPNIYIKLSDTAGLGVYGTPTTIIAVEGDDQAITVGEVFETLSVKVTDANGVAVPGVTVTFTAPSSGAGATATSSSAATDASGLATATLTANQTAGDYQIQATIAGVSTPASFSVSNLPGDPASVSVVSGDVQSATVGTAFDNALVAQVFDGFGNAIPGVVVTFTAPVSGAGGTFANNQQTATTDTDGAATSATFTANASIGSYSVVASAQGASSASYSLENIDVAVTADTVTATVAANSSDNPITLDLSGGAATAVAVVDPASHGTATASGTAITYTPTAGYSGTDSFTYTGTNSAGTSSAATVTVTVTAPTLSLSPTSLPDGQVGTSYSQTITASDGTASYGYATTGGALPDGLDLATDGTLSGMPSVDGSFSFTITATDSLGATGTWDYTLEIIEQAVTAGDATATVAANSADNAITLNLSGGTASTVVVFSQASHGTATASGTAITYTPTSGYSGTDSFTYTAGNNAGTSLAATVTVTVTAPTLSLSPASLPDGRVGTHYSLTITASAGTASYSYATTAGALPDGLDLNTDGTLSGMPSVDGTFSFTVTATDSLGAIGSRAHTLEIAEQAVTANAATATVAANSADNPITLNLSGGAANAVAVVGAASHGTASALGTAITYTPTAGYSGTDSFTYTASNSAGTSVAATVTVTVTAPTLSLSPTSLPDGQVGMTYTQTITASAGTAPYSYDVTSGTLPDGLDLATDGTLSGTPSADGSSTFIVTATDSLGATGGASHTLVIERELNLLVLTPGIGALPVAMAGEDYSAQITASGGVAPIVYSLDSGALPDGMVLNISTGELTGPLDPDTQGNYTFAILATDGIGDTGTASYSLVVSQREITVSNTEITVTPGATPTNVNLEAGATGGPFVSADVVSVEPANAGTAQIVMGEFAQAGGSTPVSFYLKFTPNPGYSGQVIVRFTLASSLGTSNPGFVTYNLGYDPVALAQQVQGATQGFVETRQDLVASTIKVPGLLERRMMAAASDPVSGRLTPSADGLVLNFATSLVEMNAAANAAAGLIAVAEPAFNLWANGTIMVHSRAANGNRWGSFGMISAGADYLLNEETLVGLSFHYDHMIDPTDPDSLLTGTGWLAGPYASIELGEGVIWDGSLLYGRSSNTIDTDFWDGGFGTSRWLLDTAISGQWQLDEVTTLTPTLRAVYLNEAVESYTVENGAGDVMVMDGFITEQLRVSLGGEITRQFVLDDGSTLTPSLGVIGGVSGLDGSTAFGSIATGLRWQSPGTVSINSGLLFNIDSSRATSVGVRAGVSGQF